MSADRNKFKNQPATETLPEPKINENMKYYNFLSVATIWILNNANKASMSLDALSVATKKESDNKVHFQFF